MITRGQLKIALQALTRRNRPVVFGDLRRLDPVSTTFGMDRGTPIDRYYIHSFLHANKALIRGRALEVGELRYLNEFPENIVEKYALVSDGQDDRVKRLKNTIVGDLTRTETLPKEEFDCFICTQTLNCIYDVGAALRGARYLLKPGGMLLGSVAGLSPISRYDMDRWGDYWRFTTLSMTNLLKQTFGTDLEVKSAGNALAAQMHLQGIAVEDLSDRAVIEYNDDNYQVTIGFWARKSP